MSNLINKVKDKMSSNKDDNNYSSDNYGSHSSNVANKADPRFDSDRDNRNDPSSRVGGVGNTQDTYGSGRTSGYGNDSSLGDQGTTGYGTGTTHDATTSGGTYDNSSRVGGYGTQDTYGSSTTSGYGQDSALGGRGNTYGDSTTSGAGYTDNARSTNAGPHGSNMLNKADPRIDSDRDNRNDPTSRTGGYGQTQDAYGSNTGAGYGDSNLGGRGNTYGDSTTSGAGYGHSSLGGRGDTYGDSTTSGAAYNDSGNNYGSSATPGSGNTAQTAGPHNSNLMNKLDPRVDSDLDGSKTYGGNKTSY